MDHLIQAGIELLGSTLRYAEVEQSGSSARLLRLGSCDFDFDIESEVFGSSSPKWLPTVNEAVKDVFQGSRARRLTLAVHADRSANFQVPVTQYATTEEREAQITWEAGILLPDDDFHISSEKVKSGSLAGDGAVDWYDVLALPDETRRRVEAIREGTSHMQMRIMPSPRAVGSVAAGLHFSEWGLLGEQNPYMLIVGWYSNFCEFAICTRDGFHNAGHALVWHESDVPYFAVSCLQQFRIKPEEVGSIKICGTSVSDDDFESLRLIFSAPQKLLNPLEVLDLESGALIVDFPAESYAPCIGAALS